MTTIKDDVGSSDQAETTPPFDFRFKYGGTYCCVVGCHNSSARDCRRGVKFYSFPRKSPGQFDAWVKKVRRQNPDGTLWIPSKYSKVCSEHFVGNAKHSDPLHPSYAPSIFPKNYEQKVGKKRNPASQRKILATHVPDEPVNPEPDDYEQGSKDTGGVVVPSVLTDFPEPIVKVEPIETDLEGNPLGSDVTPLVPIVKVEAMDADDFENNSLNTLENPTTQGTQTESVGIKGAFMVFCDIPSACEKCTQATIPDVKPIMLLSGKKYVIQTSKTKS